MGKIFVTRGRFASSAKIGRRFLKTIDAYSNVISEIPKKCREKYARRNSFDTSASPRHFNSRVPYPQQRITVAKCRASTFMSLLTVASLATRDSSLSWLEPRRGEFRNIASRRCGLRGVNNAPRRVAHPSARRTATVTPHASAMSAPEFAPGGKNSHLTALPPLRSWARARARAIQHGRPPREDVSDASRHFQRTPFFRLVRDDDFEMETERRRRESSPLDETDASLGGYNVSETLVEETAGLVSLAKASFSRFFVDRLYRQMFGVFLPGFPGVDAEHERASEVLRRTRLSRLGRNDGTLLDLGCNSGIFTERFAVEGEYDAIIAVDDAERACDAAARRTSQRRTHVRHITGDPNPTRSSVAVVLASLEDLPFQDAVFDAAHSDAGAHTWPRPSRVVEEAARVLKPGGVLVATVAVLDDASRRAMAERGVDAAAYADKRSRCFSDAGVGNMPFWDAEAACAVFAQAPDLERCEIEAADRTFAMVTCSKKSRRPAAAAGRVIKRAGEVVREDSKRNNAVQHTTRARETGAGGARVAHDASSDLASHSRRE